MTPRQVRSWINESRMAAGVLGALLPVALMGARAVYGTSVRVHDVTVDLPAQVQTNTSDIAALKTGMAAMKVSVDSIVRTTTVGNCIAVRQLNNQDARECVK